MMLTGSHNLQMLWLETGEGGLLEQVSPFGPAKGSVYAEFRSVQNSSGKLDCF